VRAAIQYALAGYTVVACREFAARLRSAAAGNGPPAAV
jgi:hypothetical protein